MIVCKCLNSISNSLSFFLQVGQEETLCKIDTDTYGGWYTAPVEDTFNGWGPPRAIDRFNDKDVVPISIDTSLRKACFQHHYLVSDSSSYLGAKVPKVETKKSWFHYIAQAVLLLACIFLAPVLITPKAHAVNKPPACVNNVVGDTGSSSNTIQVNLTEKEKREQIEKNNLTKELNDLKNRVLTAPNPSYFLRLGIINNAMNVLDYQLRVLRATDNSELFLTGKQWIEFDFNQSRVKSQFLLFPEIQPIRLNNSAFIESVLSGTIFEPRGPSYPSLIDEIPSKLEDIQREISRYRKVYKYLNSSGLSLSMGVNQQIPGFINNNMYQFYELQWDLNFNRIKFNGGIGAYVQELLYTPIEQNLLRPIGSLYIGITYDTLIPFL